MAAASLVPREPSIKSFCISTTIKSLFMISPPFTGGSPRFLFKITGKISFILKAGAGGHLPDGHAGVGQQDFGRIDSDIQDILLWRAARFLFEFCGKVSRV